MSAALALDPASVFSDAQPENGVWDFLQSGRPRLRVIDGGLPDGVGDFLPDLRQIASGQCFDPTTAQFLSRDPAVSKTMSPYGYASGDPLDITDPSGLWGLPDLNPVDWAKAGAGAVSSAASWTYNHVGKPVLDVVATAPYAIYYANYNVAHFINHLGCDNTWAIQAVTCGAAHIAALPTVPGQALGLGGDVGIDYLKGESPCDEGGTIHLDPLHSYVPGWVPDPTVYGPGVHKNGSIDFEW